jgi:transcription initiation factor TFIID subunit 6
MDAEGKRTLSALVEEHMTEIVRAAVGVQRHSKRARVQRSLQLSDVKMALQYKGEAPVYSTGLKNEKVDLNAYLQSELQDAPPDMAMTMHWLAVDGIQPNIPLNRRSNASDGNEPLLALDKAHDKEAQDSDEDPSSSSGISIRQLLPRLLAEELVLYFTRITLAIERGTPIQQDAALHSVAFDSGTQELVPFFCRFVVLQIHHNIGNAPYCHVLIRLVHALVQNPNLHLELHLNQLLPPVLTCVVAKQLSNPSKSKSTSTNVDDAFSLRVGAAHALSTICTSFGEKYASLKPKVLSELSVACQPSQPIETQFGGIVGMIGFGPKAIDAFVLPLATAYWNRWGELLEEDGSSGSRSGSEEEFRARYALHRCQETLLTALAVLFGSVAVGEQLSKIDLAKLEDVFGDKLVPLFSGAQSEPFNGGGEYLSCFI